MAKFGFDVVGRSRGSQVEVFERQRAVHELDTRIVQAGKHGRAMRIEHDRLRASQPFDVAVRSDAQNLVAAHGDRFLKIRAATRVHLAVDDDQVDRAAGVIALRTYDQARDERGADDHGNKDGRKARRHFRGYSVASTALCENDNRASGPPSLGFGGRGAPREIRRKRWGTTYS